MHVFKRLWALWKKVTHTIGIYQAKVILTIFYFTILLIPGLIFTLLKDTMGIKNRKSSSWVLRKKLFLTLEEMKNQY